MAELQRQVAAAKDAFEAAAARLAEKRARLAECDRELAMLAAEKSDLQAKLADSAAERKRHTHRHVSLKPELQDHELRDTFAPGLIRLRARGLGCGVR